MKNKKNKLVRLLQMICKMITDFDLPNLLESIKLTESALEHEEKDFLEWIEQQPNLLTDETESYIDEYQFIKSSRENIRAWLFVACYSQFENNLITICKHIEKSSLYPSLPEKDLYIGDAKKYLKEIGFKLFTNNKDWQYLFKGYRLTRNLIVHYRGRLDQHYWKEKRKDAQALKNFIDSTSTIVFDELLEEPSQCGTIRLAESFCQDFINTQKRFFKALSSEMETLL